ncbi:MAG: hypothetical protein WC872_04355 [Candidatus Absconditabacterales bacterium]|jgi:CRISPR/Cas system endoribonuclease Cas6 (RAMP superfamily)
MKQEEFIKGFFATFNDSENVKEPEAIKNGASLKKGRLGIFYQKEELIKTLYEKPFSKKNILIVTVKVAVKNVQKYNGGTKFNFPANSDVKISKVQTFDEALEEVKKTFKEETVITA